MLPCPRCGRDNPASAMACVGCHAPLAFGDEPAPSRLDTELFLDRRGRTPLPASEAAAARDFEEPDAAAFDERGANPGEEPAAEPTEPSPATDGELRPAPPARRLAAWAIDGTLVAAAAIALPAALFASVGQPPGTGAPGSGIGVALLLSEAFVGVVAFVYATAAHALAGATLGKRVARIRVVGEDGRPPAPAVSARRSAWAILSIVLAGAGLVPALAHPSRRALHDLLAGTRVVEEP